MQNMQENDLFKPSCNQMQKASKAINDKQARSSYLGPLFGLMVSFILSCAEPSTHTQEVSSTPTDSISANNSAPQLKTCGCYFELNEKYLADHDTLQVRAWQKAIVDRAAKGDLNDAGNLFLHLGGGPMGVEWNSDGNLFCVAQIQEGKKVMVQLNGHLFKGAINNHTSGRVASFSIPSALWMETLAAIDSTDYSLLFSQSAIEKNRDEPNSPLGVGKILKVHISSEGHSDTLFLKAFHVAYGE